jgi:hypothetical protein
MVPICFPETRRYCHLFHLTPQYIIACNEYKLMHYLSSVNAVTIPLRVSGLLVDINQAVTMYIQHLVRVVGFS